jgi:hypothetical protein
MCHRTDRLSMRWSSWPIPNMLRACLARSQRPAPFLLVRREMRRMNLVVGLNGILHRVDRELAPVADSALESVIHFCPYKTRFTEACAPLFFIRHQMISHRSATRL